jgi:hypothetical protein
VFARLLELDAIEQASAKCGQDRSNLVFDFEEASLTSVHSNQAGSEIIISSLFTVNNLVYNDSDVSTRGLTCSGHSRAALLHSSRSAVFIDLSHSSR